MIHRATESDMMKFLIKTLWDDFKEVNKQISRSDYDRIDVVLNSMRTIAKNYPQETFLNDVRELTEEWEELKPKLQKRWAVEDMVEVLRSDHR